MEERESGGRGEEELYRTDFRLFQALAFTHFGFSTPFRFRVKSPCGKDKKRTDVRSVGKAAL